MACFVNMVLLTQYLDFVHKSNLEFMSLISIINQMLAWSPLNDSRRCHEVVDNGAAAEDDSWDDTGDSGRGDESSICPMTTGNTSNEV